MPKKILITGGCHPVGIALARTLLKGGHTITLFDTRPLSSRELKGKVQLIQGDITKSSDIQQAVAGQTVVIHTAETTGLGQKKKKLISINVTGTELLVKACLEARISRVIYLSTTAVYGLPHELPQTENSPLNPLDRYSTSKVMAERICKTYMDRGLPTTILRPRPTLGPGVLGPFSLWFETLYSGHRLLILGNGKNKYQLLALSDLCSAVEKAITSPTTNTIYNLGAREYQALRKDLQSLIRFDKAPSHVTGLPTKVITPLLGLLRFLSLSPLSKRHYKTISQPSFTSIDKAVRELSWEPIKSNKDLLLESYLWYKKNRKRIQTGKYKMQQSRLRFPLFDLVTRF